VEAKRITVWVQKFADRGSLVLQWIDPDTGKRKSRSAKTDDADDAEQKRGDLEYELNNGKYQEASRMSWERFRELFEAEYVTGCRLNTRRNFLATFDLFEKLCSPRSLKAISARTVSLFVAGLRKEPGRAAGSTGMMPSTIKVRLQFLHTALSWAVTQKMIPAVPEFPVVKVPVKAPQPVPAEAFEKLLEKAADPQMKVYLQCGWLAGLRLTEALALEREPSEEAPFLDLGRNRIILPAAVVKAVMDQWVPLAPELREALEGLPRHGRKVFRFTNHRGEVLGAGAVSQKVRALARKAGVRLTMKTLRKGFGCRYAGKVPAQVLQKLMRHANIKTTMDYYANIDDAVEEAVLGSCNSSRNTDCSPEQKAKQANDANSSGETANSPSAN
jgi:integrase